MGETRNRLLQFSFSALLKLDFQASRVTSGGAVSLDRAERVAASLTFLLSASAECIDGGATAWTP